MSDLRVTRFDREAGAAQHMFQMHLRMHVNVSDNLYEKEKD